MNKYVVNLLLVFPIFLLGELSFASSEQEDSLAEYYKDQLAGYEVVIFQCISDNESKIGDKLCQRAKTDIELLAAASDLNLKVADSQYASYLLVNENRAVELVLFIRTAERNYASSVYISLTYKHRYSNAIEKNASPNSLDGMPRSGDLELWSNDLIGVGDFSGRDISVLTDNVEVLLKKAITIFLKHAKN